MTRGPQKQFDREQVLDRAMELFWSRGYEATGVTELLEHMGIGRQSLYNTFGDKRALYNEAVQHYFRSRIAPIVTMLRAPGSAVGNLKQVFAYWESMIGKGGHGCLIGNSVAELGGSDAELAELLRQYLDGMEDEFYRVVRRARETGEIESRVSDRDLARMLVNTSQGLALMSKIKPDRAAVRSVVRSLMAAIGPA